MSSKTGSKKKKGSRWGNAAAAAAAKPVAAAAAKPKSIAGGGRGNVIAMEEDQARKIRYVYAAVIAILLSVVGCGLGYSSSIRTGRLLYGSQ